MVLVLTYNCNQGKGNVKNLCKLIKNSQADIICLQEFNDTIKSSLILNQYTLIEPPGNQGWFKNVIYTKLSIRGSPTYLSLNNMKRQIPIVSLRYGRNVINVACLHLSAGIEKYIDRQNELATILRFMKNRKRLLLAGDFNMRSDEKVPISLNCSKLIGTYTSNNPLNKGTKKFNLPFDRVIYRGLQLQNQPILVGNSSKTKRTTASDHYGLLFKFNLDNNLSQCSLM